MINAVSWFQIPVSDMTRAVKFYSTIFSAEFQQLEALGAKIAVFPHDHENGGIGGGLYFGEGFEPTEKGAIVLLNGGDDLNTVLSKVTEAGGTILIEKTGINNNNGFIARFTDSEGNRVGLHSKN